MVALILCRSEKEFEPLGLATGEFEVVAIYAEKATRTAYIYSVANTTIVVELQTPCWQKAGMYITATSQNIHQLLVIHLLVLFLDLNYLYGQIGTLRSAIHAIWRHLGIDNDKAIVHITKAWRSLHIHRAEKHQRYY